MISFSRALKLPPQLKWTYAHEPELLGWTIRARNYITRVANNMFMVVAFLVLGVSLLIYSAYEGMDQPWRTGSCIFFYLLMMLVTSSMTHQRMKFAYRFTQSGVEYCKWKEFPDWMLTFLKWLAGITAVFCVFLATIDPAFLWGALIGTGGMGLTYFSMAHSKSYREMHTQYHHYAFQWKDFTQLAVATNREVVDLQYRIKMKGEKYKINWSLNIFCQRNQKEFVADFIKPYLSPKVPVIRAKVDVPMSTD